MNNQSSNIKTIGKLVGGTMSIVLVTIAIYAFITTPDTEIKESVRLIQKDIEVIEENHLGHIQQELEEQKEWNERVDARLNSIDYNLGKILGLLEK